MALELEELKRRWLKSAPPLPPWNKPYSGKRERERKDVEKLALLARLNFKSWFEVTENGLIFRKMFEECSSD